MSSVDAVPLRVVPDVLSFAYGTGRRPVATVSPGARLTVVTRDARDGAHADRPAGEAFDLPARTTPANGLTGPIAVAGADVGDALVVDVEAIRPVGVAWAAAAPGIGPLAPGRIARARARSVPPGPRVLLGALDVGPAAPMIGCIGTAPPAPVCSGLAGSLRRQPRSSDARPRRSACPAARGPPRRPALPRRRARGAGRRRAVGLGPGDRGRGRPAARPPGRRGAGLAVAGDARPARRARRRPPSRRPGPPPSRRWSTPSRASSACSRPRRWPCSRSSATCACGGRTAPRSPPSAWKCPPPSALWPHPNPHREAGRANHVPRDDRPRARRLGHRADAHARAPVHGHPRPLGPLRPARSGGRRAAHVARSCAPRAGAGARCATTSARTPRPTTT